MTATVRLPGQLSSDPADSHPASSPLEELKRHTLPNKGEPSSFDYLKVMRIT
ncbi:hypothetical protein [uncultured Corynebacterium sp.]|uniref:hypothetical protein n=1 Tax=uncultured Corynebacterium sp. TaxID=159447 RepID=UPI0025E99241|nr:hypothetical protein [uncultured Corynebacterium sp.]